MYALPRITTTLARAPAEGRATAALNRLASPQLSRINREAVERIEQKLRPGTALAKDTHELATHLVPMLDEHAANLMQGPGRWIERDQRDAWFAHQTALTLRHLANFTDRQYRPLVQDMPLESAIMPAHLALLEQTLRRRFDSLCAADKIKMAASIEPGVLESCGVKLPGDLRHAIEQQRSGNFHRLTKAEVLAMVDYVHMDTKTFVVVNGSARLSHYFGFSALADVAQCLDGPRKSAMRKLAGNQDFIQFGDMYKGVDFNNPAGPLSLSNLSRSFESGSAFTLPHTLSATSDPAQSYAYRSGYDTEIMFKGCQAMKVSGFHHPDTAEQNEVLVRNDVRFRVIDMQTIQLETPDGPRIIERFTVEPVDAA